MTTANKKPRITGMTLAVTEMEKMIEFYSEIFQLNFEKTEMYGATLYNTQINDVAILFCPAEIAENTAKQNRHQLEFEVQDLKKILSVVKKHHGSTMGNPTENDGIIQVGINDPDNNSIVLKQIMN
ncbi:VOC family protein [Ekhidna sp.]|uniref:VOC family protein n=1 Tax=Ekhidna sp. TaxID=2608089 RepID=UPI003C7A5D79